MNEDDGRRIGSRSDSQINREEKFCDDQQENKHREDEDREAKTQTGVRTNISTKATDHDQLQILGSCGELDAPDVCKARRLEVDYLRKM